MTISNQTRELRGASALSNYQYDFMASDDPRLDIINLVTDILHYADSQGMDVEDISQQALNITLTERGF